MKSKNKHFCLLKSPNSQYSFVCFSMDSVRPDEYIELIQAEFTKMTLDGQLLFDLLSCNGDSSRRFLTVQIKASQIKWSSAKVTPRAVLEATTVQFCSKFYENNPSAIEKSILSPAARHRLLKSPSFA